MREMTVEDLQRRLARHDRLAIVDIRDEDEHAEWSVPGSVRSSAYDAIMARDPAAFGDTPLPRDAPVVVVCWAGNTSRVGAGLLAQRGLDAYSLAGGMRAWSLAWNVAEVAPGIVQVRRTGKGCLSYVVGSEGEACVVDASLPPEVYLDACRARGWTIRHVLDTHVHADHLTRGPALAAATGATYRLPRTPRARFPHEPLGEGDEVRVGRSTIRVLATPGHTPESACYLVDGTRILTGDTLFVSSVGRPDLEAAPEETRRRARQLHASLASLFALPPETVVLPGHTSRPVDFDGCPVAATLREVRSRLTIPLQDASAFVEALLPRIPATPPNHHAIVERNEAGAALPLDPTELEAGANRCAVQ